MYGHGYCHYLEAVKAQTLPGRRVRSWADDAAPPGRSAVTRVVRPQDASAAAKAGSLRFSATIRSVPRTTVGCSWAAIAAA